MRGPTPCASEHVGDAVHLRGLIEISSHCARQCMYCGLRQANRALAALSHDAEKKSSTARARPSGLGTAPS